MMNLGRIKMPPLKNVLDVAMQTVRQQIPDKPGQSSRPPQNVRFANLDMGESCELSTMNETTSPTYQSTNPTNPFLSGELQAEDSFTSYQNTYPQQDGAPRTQSMQSVDFYASSEEGGFEEGGGKPGAKINEYQAAWNVTNAIQGMFVVSLPFAVLQGGYWAIAAMIGIAHICCYTGKILVECLYEDDPVSGQRVRVRDSYVSIAKECFGRKYGARVVNIAQIIELLMTCILYVVVCGDLMIGTFPDGSIDTRSWMMLTGIFLLPLAFLKSLKSVSMLSFWCTMSHLIINAIVLGYCILNIGDWGWSKVKWNLDFENFPISLGVIVFSYTSQIFLPTLEGNLEDRSKFEWMLNWSHIAAAAFKSIFGYLCFLTFQNDTQQVITNNLRSAGFKGLVNFFLVIKAVLSYPLPYYAACDLLERALFRGKPKTLFPTIYALDGELKVWGLAWRLGVIIFTVLMAIFIPHFAILMGFIGSFTGTMLSFIWPAYFHLKLKGNQLESTTIAYDYFIIGLGVLFGIIGMYDSGSALVKAFKIGLPF
ncbi:PREDICTED: vesicular inhibitory amino acid transporter [Papilio polytes]|uniref:vesicular inhibitory amino acid transporter n=1 Tax=Papilio polytes TaxID=76194 RepID=UPI000675C9EC|nr:PREDICTED: vesicular inhibitory amino acid transporter [Papilio polytes]